MNRIELLTFRLSDERSDQLSYTPIFGTPARTLTLIGSLGNCGPVLLNDRSMLGLPVGLEPTI